jgi:hypothetical protein
MRVGIGVEAWIYGMDDWFRKAYPYWWKEGHELQRHLPLPMQRMLEHAK